ncbi:MAG: adenine-specific DNA methylase [Pseudomonadota bacterium]
MRIDRAWAMPNKWTFKIKPIARLLAEEMDEGGWWVDPFAGMNSPARMTNDVNPAMGALYHEDALVFLRMQVSMLDMMPASEAFDGGLFDPPYSVTQVQRSYLKLGLDIRPEMTQWTYWAACLDEMARVIKIGGKLIRFGWNSNGAGRSRGFRKDRILLVCHGGGHNDTIVTVETKIEDRAQGDLKL